jgi:hypothetical protein
MLRSHVVKSDSTERARGRLREALLKTIEREQALGPKGFLQLPPKVQNQLAVLQAQSLQDDDSLEGILASERILARYHDRLDNAQNLVAQMAGEAGRRTLSRHQIGRWALVALAALAVVAAAVTLYYRRSLAEKAQVCRASDGCTVDGLCGAVLPLSGPAPLSAACAAESAEHCASSKGCRELGRCSAVDGVCVAATNEDCAGTPGCENDGFCSARDGGCVAAEVHDCRRTKACAERGACTPIDGQCKPGSDADCRQSELCRRQGACHEVQQRCVEVDFEP